MNGQSRDQLRPIGTDLLHEIHKLCSSKLIASDLYYYHRLYVSMFLVLVCIQRSAYMEIVQKQNGQQQHTPHMSND